ncbi:another transcription unit protein isoform X2 [Drosophila mauritiana]|nr:another transcription unit protein isoform X2 [Drosophila mauritiana]
MNANTSSNIERSYIPICETSSNRESNSGSAPNSSKSSSWSLSVELNGSVPEQKSSVINSNETIHSAGQVGGIQSCMTESGGSVPEPKSSVINSNETIHSAGQVGGIQSSMTESDGQGSVDSETISSIRKSTSLIELKDNYNAIIDEVNNQQLTNEGNILPTETGSISNFKSLKEEPNGSIDEMELELLSTHPSSTPINKCNDMEEELLPLQFSSFLPTPSEEYILKPKASFVPLASSSNTEHESKGNNCNTEKWLSQLRYSSDEKESKDLYSSSDSLDLNFDIGDNAENQQPGGKVNAAKELFSNGILQNSQVLDTLEQLKPFGKDIAVKFQSTITTENCGLLKGPSQFLKMPYFIPVESEAYVPETFQDQMTEDDLKDEQSRNDFINRLKATVRWRENENKTKESNAKIIRWSDGTQTFHVGNEVFDMMQHPVTVNQNHLYVRLDSCYQPQGLIKNKLTVRPILDSSFGQSHVQALRNRATNKPQSGCVKVITNMGSNPEHDHNRRMKEELSKLRQEDREKNRAFMKNRPPKRDRHYQGSDRNVAKKPGAFEEDDAEGAGGETSSAAEDSDEEMRSEEDTENHMDDGASRSSPNSQKEGSQLDSEDELVIGGANRKPKRLVYSDSDSD